MSGRANVKWGRLGKRKPNDSIRVQILIQDRGKTQATTSRTIHGVTLEEVAECVGDALSALLSLKELRDEQAR